MRGEEEIIHAINTYSDMVKRICFIHLKQDADVEDIFQDVFLKYANGPHFESDEHEKAWLIRVSINACKDSLTSWFHKKVILHDNLEIYENIPFLTKSHDDQILSNVLKLKENYRNVIYLYYYEGYKIKEIAQILHKKENTIHTWMKRAKEELRYMLGGDYLE